MSLLLQEEEIADLVSDVSLHSTMSLLLRRMAKKTMRQRSFLYIPLCLYYYVEQVYPGEIKFTLHSTMSLLLLTMTRSAAIWSILYIPLCLYYYTCCNKSKWYSTRLYIPLCLYYYWIQRNNAKYWHDFTFHYVSITTRTSQSPTLQSQFYHFLSTLSFSLLIEYKYQQYRKKISYFYSKIAYLSTSHVFCFITGRQL